MPRIKESLRVDARNSTSSGSFEGGETTPHIEDLDRIFFNSDRMYQHHLLRINFTTYDVRRSQDVINPGTLRRDIMVLANNQDPKIDHPFWFARVLGIYHVNVVYTGSGMLDYTPRRFDFLWVRWFSNMATCQLVGKNAVLTSSPSHPWRIKTHLVLLIPRMCYDVAISFLASAGEGFIPIWSHCLSVPMMPEIGLAML